PPTFLNSDEQKNLYKALVDAYESDKLIVYTYGDMRIKMKNHPLDQIGGPREEELEKNQSQPVH
ncbi:hypothetical protein Tco_0501219, partial [Tanacetum coccineum]